MSHNQFRMNFVVCTPFLLGGEPPTKFQKGGGLNRISIFRGDCWERGGDLFQEGLQLLHK